MKAIVKLRIAPRELPRSGAWVVFLGSVGLLAWNFVALLTAKADGNYHAHLSSTALGVVIVLLGLDNLVAGKAWKKIFTIGQVMFTLLTLWFLAR